MTPLFSPPMTTRSYLLSDTVARFWAKVDKTDTCWLWTAATRRGYGAFGVNGRMMGAHRLAYELMVGPIPVGMQLDHLCRVRHCVRPEHLEPVTAKENIQRGQTGPSRGRQQRAKTHCPHGHPYDEENTRIYLGHRHCRACQRVHNRARFVKIERKDYE